MPRLEIGVLLLSIRISSVFVRSAHWLVTSFMALHVPSWFGTFGAWGG